MPERDAPPQLRIVNKFLKNLHHHNLILFSAVISIALFIVITIAVTIGAVAPLDNFWTNIFAKVFTGGVLGINQLNFLVFVTNIASPLVLASLSVVVYSILIWRKRGFYDLVFITALTIGIILTIATKYLLDVPRPSLNLVNSFTPSFPSSHTALATIFFLTVAYAFRHEVRSLILGRVFEIICFVLIILIATSRFLLGAHRPSEIVAGFLIGVFSVTFSLLLFKRFEQKSGV